MDLHGYDIKPKNTFYEFLFPSINHIFINPSTLGNTWVCNQHCGYWCPGAKAPGHQYPQCWLNIHCIGPVSYKNIAPIVNNIRKYWKEWPNPFRVNIKESPDSPTSISLLCLHRVCLWSSRVWCLSTVYSCYWNKIYVIKWMAVFVVYIEGLHKNTNTCIWI